MSGARDLDFQAVSDLILEVNFQINCSTLLNRIRKREEDNESNLKIKEECDFFEHSNQFDKELVENLFKPPKIKNLNFPTLNHKFKMLKQQKQKQRMRMMSSLILNKNLMQ